MVCIINLEDTVTIKWTANNKQWYVDKGYEYTGQWTELTVKIKDLPKGSQAKVLVTCDYCGVIKKISYYTYNKIVDETMYYCCNKCKGKKITATTYQRRQEKEWKKLSIVCEEKGYKIITNKDSYTSTKMYIEYVCPKHGVQSSLLNNMLAGHGCVMCKYESQGDCTKLSPDYVEQMVNSCNGNKLLNKEEYIRVNEPNLRIRCACGNVYTVSFGNYRKGQTRCCQCSNKQSYNEYKIQCYLQNEGIPFEKEKTFPDLKYKANLRFDFYLPDYNLAIEYDGEGHYLEYFYRNFSENPHELLLKAQCRDNIKNDYCVKNGINLLRIPYWDAEKIEPIISQKLDELKIA